MCTLILSIDPSARWPVCAAATRDEFEVRPWSKPGYWWPEQPSALGGRDEREGGSWCVVDGASGRAALVLNRMEPLAAPAKFSRGRLPLLALATETLEGADLRGYAPFNLVVLTARRCQWWRWDGVSLTQTPITPGVHLLTSADMDDVAASPRIRRWLPQFRSALRPNAASSPDWSEWRRMLEDPDSAFGDASALNVKGFSHLPGYRTLSAVNLALSLEAQPSFHFATPIGRNSMWASYSGVS